LSEIILPYRFIPRTYQLSMMAARDAGYLRYLGVWHRRGGKDKTALNVTIKEMGKVPGNYYYFFPTYNQGRKILWDGIDPRTGIKYLDHFPPELMASKPNETQMKVKFRNGSVWQIVGTDDFNAIMGTNPIGCVFSEYSLQNPQAWEYIKPILAENKGWAIFIYTPRGKNHGFTLYKMALNNPDWYVERLTVNDTARDDGSPVISPADIETERAEGMDDDLINQEFYCSFEGYLVGAYYAKQLKQARADGRITRVPYVPTLPVETFWDLGMDDSMTIWFVQPVGPAEIRIIDYYENNGEGLSHYAKVLKEKPYVYNRHNMPHDAKVRELGTGKSRQEVAESFGIKPVEIIDDIGINNGIEAVRNIFPRCYFDEVKCQRGLDALESYTKEYDEEKKCFKDKPLHNWASHGADSFRMFGVGFRDRVKVPKKSKAKAGYLAQ
jgi:phage terminase large subunit